ncbi:MAG: tryptophan--tRNA ligase [Candidatus Omnitrophica bacterium]|nr:tryptophan--tRNA ligase [Candidatus Omnitrophota bacterium]
MKPVVFSGMRPTGKLHLGHLVGALKNWVPLQDTHSCVYSIVDWHALMGEYEQSKAITSNVYEMALDWLACGLDPDKSVIFVQSDVPEHLELQMVFSCITPLGWLERNPTYKEQLREIKTRDLQTYGFLGYPVLQAADILLYRATAVPIGEDQLPHLELSREIGRRFNFIFKADFFADCNPILTETPRLLGFDGRKMSKSYQNAINLSDTPEEIRKKVMQMITDPSRIKLTDPGHPDVCQVFSYYKVFIGDKIKEVETCCTGAKIGCTECKRNLANILTEKLAPIREARAAWAAKPKNVKDILDSGAQKARALAQETMRQIRAIIF